jgi:hypothetical protein
MTIYYLKQDNTIWGCGDPECCGEYYEEIDEEFVDCAHEVEVDADHLHSCNGGGPVLEWRKASSLEETAYRNGKDNSYYDGYDSGWEFGIKQTEERIIKLLREKAKHLKQVSESIAMDDYMSDEDAAVPENGAFALNEFADALIKGEK